VCTMGDEVNPCVAHKGRPCRRSQGVSIAYSPADATATHHLLLHSKSRLVLPFLVLPFWYLLTRVVPDKFQNSSKTVVCVCVIIDSKLIMSQHVSKMVSKARIRANLIFKCFHSRDRHTLLKAFITYVLANTRVRLPSVVTLHSNRNSQS